jgi:hypothetical protein
MPGPPIPPPGQPIRGPLFPPRFWFGSFTLRWFDLALGSSLSSRFSFHAPNIFFRGTIFRGGGGGGSLDDLCEGTGAIGPGGACPTTVPASNKPTPPKTKIFPNCFMAFFPEGSVSRIPTGFIPSDARQSSRVASRFLPARFKDHLTPRQCRIRLSPVGGSYAPNLSPALRFPRRACH